MAKILIVDDDNDFRSMLAELFNLAAYTVIESRDGQEGLKMAKTLGANQIFIKPINNKKMLETVHALSNCQKNDFFL